MPLFNRKPPSADGGFGFYIRTALVALLLLFHYSPGAQELFVFTEPASNMPAHSVSPRLTAAVSSGPTPHMQRYTAEAMLGFSNKFMVHAGTGIANRDGNSLRWESVFAYAKYRFLSRDEVHAHFRMAAFTDISYNRYRGNSEEVTLSDRSGIQAGLIATQLLNKWAISGTVSHTQVFDAARKNNLPGDERNFQSVNYSLSAGYLILPREYKSFDQLNLNVYLEFLGQQALDHKSYYLDMAPALQMIFKSNSKLSLGYRFGVTSNQSRSMNPSVVLTMEHTFFNALK